MKYQQVPTNTNIYRQIQSNTNMYRHVQSSSTDSQQLPAFWSTTQQHLIARSSRPGRRETNTLATHRTRGVICNDDGTAETRGGSAERQRPPLPTTPTNDQIEIQLRSCRFQHVHNQLRHFRCYRQEPIGLCRQWTARNVLAMILRGTTGRRERTHNILDVISPSTVVGGLSASGWGRLRTGIRTSPLG